MISVILLIHFTLLQVLSLGHQVACAMEYLHSCGVIHRDLKTGNVLLDSQV